MTTALQQKMRFASQPYHKRIALIPMTIAIALAWVLLAVSFAVASMVLQHSALWGSVSLFTACSLTVYLIFLTCVWFKDSNQRHELVIDGDLVSLSSYDDRNNNKINQRISLSEVISAEYYEPRDTSSLVLKGSSNSLDIPLWSFGTAAEKTIVTHVKASDIPVIGIPSDIVT